MAIRLINTDTLHLTSFMGDRIPKYAILSHSWEADGEISFQEIAAISEYPNHPAAEKSGYRKVVKTCQKAKTDGIPYAWVDTCCIDKTSSSELSEAINTMYQWYQKAEVCYALLSDFDVSLATSEAGLPGCRWFSRGWCLQELLAPSKLEFFDLHWNHIGSKSALAPLISKITRIDEQVLFDTSSIGAIPVARRMSWAARRETTRAEDMAYCLLGIFDVNMPMLYGEGGPKAFMRLQEEIIKSSNDLSIFAFLHGSTSQGPALSQPYCNLFATSPRDFIGCGELTYTKTDVYWSNVFALTNKGLHFPGAELQVDVQHGLYSMSLNCKLSESKFARMYLRKVGPGLFARYNDSRSVDMISETEPYGDDVSTEIEEAYVVSKVTPPVQLQLERADEYAIHIWSRDHHMPKALQVLQRSVSSNRWDTSRMQFLTKGEKSVAGYWKVFPSLARRIKGEDDHQIPSGHFYLVCGLEHFGHDAEPRAWLRLYSSKEWGDIVTKMGIVTDLNNVLSQMNSNNTSDHTILDTKSPNPPTITAAVKLEMGDGKPRFEVELNLEEKTKA